MESSRVIGPAEFISYVKGPRYYYDFLKVKLKIQRASWIFIHYDPRPDECLDACTLTTFTFQ